MSFHFSIGITTKNTTRTVFYLPAHLNRVALSKNIHRYRWGDAPLRWLTVHIFFHQNETQFFCDFDYRHKNIVWEAVPGGNANCQLEESSPGKEIPYTKWEQHQELLANKQLQ